MKVTAGLAAAEVEVIDDGGGTAAARSGQRHRGNGLAGLRERAEAMRGRIEAGGLPGGGFRLAVSVPVVRDPGS